MTDHRLEWCSARDELLREIRRLGYPQELGMEIAKYLGSPKAISRMSAYIRYSQPESAEIIVDEMLAIKSEIDEWKKKKAAQEANAAYNEILAFGLDPDCGKE